jgi:hypothetical protein
MFLCFDVSPITQSPVNATAARTCATLCLMRNFDWCLKTKVRYSYLFGMAVTNENYSYEEFESRANSGNSCYHSVSESL